MRNICMWLFLSDIVMLLQRKCDHALSYFLLSRNLAPIVTCYEAKSFFLKLHDILSLQCLDIIIIIYYHWSKINLIIAQEKYYKNFNYLIIHIFHWKVRTRLFTIFYAR